MIYDIAAFGCLLYKVFFNAFLASKHHRQTNGQTSYSAAAAETTTSPRSGDTYEELDMTSRVEPVYKELTR